MAGSEQGGLVQLRVARAVSSLKVLLRRGTHVAIVERYGFKGRSAPVAVQTRIEVGTR